MDFNVRSESVDIEQIMEQIRARIREKRGVDYTEEQLRELAAVKLEKFLDPRGVRSDLLQRFKERQPRALESVVVYKPAEDHDEPAVREVVPDRSQSQSPSPPSWTQPSSPQLSRPSSPQLSQPSPPQPSQSSPPQPIPGGAPAEG